MRLYILAPPLASAFIALGTLSALAGPVHMDARPPIHSNLSQRLFNFHGRMVAGPFASARLSSAWAHRLPAELQRHHGLNTYVWNPNICGNKLLFGSENVTGNLDEYCEDGGPGQPPFATVAAGGGWGIAVKPTTKIMAVGVNGGTINIYPDATNLPGTPVVLTLSGATNGYNALGLCWDNMGGLFATNWPGNTIDYFANPLASGGPTSTISTQVAAGVPMEDYHIACDFDNTETGNNGYLMVYAFNLDGVTDPSVVAEVAQPYNSGPQNVTVSQTLGSLSNGTGFPGGLTLSNQDDLLANNQYGTLLDLGKVEPWNGPITGSCTWGFSPNDFTDIVYAKFHNEVWVSNTPTTNQTYLQSLAPPPLSGACVTPGESGGPTTPMANENYLGVAVYKASKT